MVMTTSRRFCSDCGTENPSLGRFCVACGLPLYPADSVLPLDHLLKERYRIVEHIGSGGFGEVYRAVDTQFAERVVAIKAMSQSGLSAQEATEASEAFKREAFMLAKLVHPNLPAIYDYFAEQASWYLVMSFIEGETLEHRLIQSGGTFGVDEVLQIGSSLSSVLEYLHNRQPSIIFRDLKPSNIMRTPEGQLYLIDFGIARLFKQGQSRDTMALGSPGYAAPEQYGKVQSTPRSDIYSLGATLHHLLSGRDPAESPFMFPPLIVPGYPGLNELIQRMLAKDTTQRPANMAEVRQELQQIASGRPHGLAAREAPRQAPIFVVPNTDDRSSDTGYAEMSYERGAMAQQAERRQQQQQEYYRPPVAPKRGLSRRQLLLTGGVAGLGILAFNLLNRPFNRPHPPTNMVVATPAAMPTLLKDVNGLQIPDTALLSVAWSADGQRYAAGGMLPDSLKVYSTTGNKVLTSYSGHTGTISALSWSPDGRTIASASYDTTVQLWNATSGEHILSYTDHAAPVLAVSCSPDGKFVASADALHVIHIWNAQTGATVKVFGQHRDQVTSVAWSPDGMLLASASADKTVNVWDFRTGSAVMTYVNHHDVVQSVAWSPNGQRIASASDDKTVQVWNSLSGAEAVIYKDGVSPVWSATWSPDGQHIASASWDTTVQIWDTSKNAVVYTFRGHSSPVLAVCWSSTGQIVSVDLGGIVHVWKPEGI
jgi:serine/threonine protein kinase/Tol biopolymer transport system component